MHTRHAQYPKIMGTHIRSITGFESCAEDCIMGFPIIAGPEYRNQPKPMGVWSATILVLRCSCAVPALPQRYNFFQTHLQCRHSIRYTDLCLLCFQVYIWQIQEK